MGCSFRLPRYKDKFGFKFYNIIINKFIKLKLQSSIISLKIFWRYYFIKQIFRRKTERSWDVDLLAGLHSSWLGFRFYFAVRFVWTQVESADLHSSIQCKSQHIIFLHIPELWYHSLNINPILQQGNQPKENGKEEEKQLHIFSQPGSNLEEMTSSLHLLRIRAF